MFFNEFLCSKYSVLILILSGFTQCSKPLQIMLTLKIPIELPLAKSLEEVCKSLQVALEVAVEVSESLVVAIAGRWGS